MAFTPDVGVRVEMVGLAPGFASRIEVLPGGARIVVRAPYGITGSVPAEVVATCEIDEDPAAVALPVTVRVRPLRAVVLDEDALARPPPRAFAALVALPGADSRIVVAGGTSAGAALADVWSWDSSTNAWARLVEEATEGGPSGVLRAALDRRGRVLIHDDAGRLFVLDAAARPATVTPVVAAGTHPDTTAGAGFVHHERSDVVLSLCGGTRAPQGGGAGPTVAPRHCIASAFARDDGIATWTVLEPTGFAPAGRAGAVVDVDEEGNRLVLFGGERDDGPGQDTWALSLDALPGSSVTFTRLGKEDDPPAPRAWGCGAIDPAGRRFFVFGGSDGDAPVESLSVLDLERDDAGWRSVNVAGLPPGRVGCAAAWDEARQRVVVGFGRDAVAEQAELWALEL